MKRLICLGALALVGCVPPPATLKPLQLASERTCAEYRSYQAQTQVKEYRCNDDSVIQVLGTDTVVIRDFRPVAAEKGAK